MRATWPTSVRPEVVVEADADEVLARDILERAVEGEVAGGARPLLPGETVDLDHGTMVPLVYLLGGLQRRAGLVLLSFSLLDLQEHARFGAIVGEACSRAEQRVLYVASSDLSHRLMPGAPAGFDPRGARVRPTRRRDTSPRATGGGFCPSIPARGSGW